MLLTTITVIVLVIPGGCRYLQKDIFFNVHYFGIMWKCLIETILMLIRLPPRLNRGVCVIYLVLGHLPNCWSFYLFYFILFVLNIIDFIHMMRRNWPWLQRRFLINDTWLLLVWLGLTLVVNWKVPFSRRFTKLNRPITL